MAAPAPAAIVPSSASDFFDLLHKSGLFKPDVLNEKLGEFDMPPDAAGAAAVLVRSGLLTQFQTRLLLAGKYRGFKLGTYHIRDQIGRGGMGTVYLAEHATLRRKVALKVLAAEGAGQKVGVERFLREARAAAALDHPNIVRVFDVHQSGELHYIVMEYVEGRTLDSLVQGGGAMAAGRAVAYLSQAAAGLQHAFEKGFVHRDIKPANLMVAKDGTVKILDMGLARSTVDDGDRVTELLDDGAVVGTADFISPEQATNQPGVDIRADIYSLGATLFALIAGQPPFAGSTSQVLMQHQLKAPPSLADFDRTIAPGLAAVVAKMLAKKPADRFATPSDVIAALAPWLPNRDGVQKVMAGLSSSELGRNSGTLQNTLDQVLSSSTRNLPRPDLAAAAKSRKAGWVVAAAGTAAAVLGAVALYIVKGGLEPSPGGRKEVDGPPAVVATAAGPVTAVRSATPPRTEGRFLLLPLADIPTAGTDPLFGPRDFFKMQDWGRREVNGVPFDLAGAPPGTAGKVIMLRGTAGGQARTAPERVTLPVGRPVAAIHFLGGVAAWAWPFQGKEVGDDPQGKVVLTVRVRYADGKEEEFPWKNGEHVSDYIRREDVPDSEFAFADDTGHQVRYLTVKPSRAVAVQAIELVKGELANVTPVVYAVTVEGLTAAARGGASATAAKPAGPALYRFDPATLPEFRGTMQGWEKVLYGSIPKLPTGLQVSSWKATATADFTRATAAGRPALGFAARGADPTAEVIFSLDELGVKLVADREYTARLDYLTEGDAVAALRAQEAGGSHPTLAEQPLAPTGGQWRTAEVRFRKPAGTTRLVIQADKASEAGMVHLGRLEVVEPSAAAGGKPVLFRFDAASVPEFKTGLLKNRATEGVPADLAGAAFVGCFRADATGELVRTTLDGAPALGIAARSGTPSAQLVWGLESDDFDPDREYLLRVVYQSRGDVGGVVLVQNISQNYSGLATVPLAPGGAGWQTAEAKFKRPAGAVIKLAFQSLQQGAADGMAYVRTVELVDLTATKPLFRLDPAELTAFRQTVRNRAKLSGTDGQFPAGVGPFAWKPETEAEFAVEPVDGKPALRLTNLRGPTSAQMMFNLESPDNGMGLTLTPGKGYELRLEYKTTGGAAGRAYAQSADYKETAPGETLLDTGGEWRAFRYPFTRGAAPLRLLVDLDGSGAGKSLYLRAVELVEGGSPAAAAAPAPPPPQAPPAVPALAVGRAVFALDLGGLPTFRGQFADGHAADGVPTSSGGVSWYCWKKESVAEFRGEPTDAGPALGMTNLNDDTSAQLNLPLDDATGGVSLQAGKRYVLRVQYRTTNDAAGSLQVRTPDDKAVSRADLPGTGGGWKWADLPFARGDGQKLHAVLENGSVGEGNTLWLRAAELHEAR